MVFDKSDQHQNVYDSYDLELAAKHVQLLTLENSSATYSLTGQLEHNISNKDEKRWLHQIFAAYYSEGCSVAQLTQYKNNEIKQELTKEKIILEMILIKDCILIMRRSKGYADELEKLTRDDGGVTLTIKLKKAAEKKRDWELLHIHRLNIGTQVQIKAI